MRVDDLYQPVIAPRLPNRGGPSPALSDGEMFCCGLAAEWRAGAPWQSERGFMRDASKYLRPLFPRLTTRSGFNHRRRAAHNYHQSRGCAGYTFHPGEFQVQFGRDALYEHLDFMSLWKDSSPDMSTQTMGQKAWAHPLSAGNHVYLLATDPARPNLVTVT